MKELSRRSLLKGGALLAGASAVGVTQLFNVLPAAAQFNSDIDVLNYALTLEHLEATFDREGLNRFGAGAFDFVPSIGPKSARQYLIDIRDHEQAHKQIAEIKKFDVYSTDLEARKAELDGLRVITNKMDSELRLWKLEMDAKPRISIIEPASRPSSNDALGKYIGVAFASMLGLVVIGVFFSFVLLVAFVPSAIAVRIFAGSNLTVGVALGFFQFVFFCLLTWVYVRRANGEFDTLNEQIIQDALRKTK